MSFGVFTGGNGIFRGNYASFGNDSQSGEFAGHSSSSNETDLGDYGRVITMTDTLDTFSTNVTFGAMVNSSSWSGEDVSSSEETGVVGDPLLVLNSGLGGQPPATDALNVGYIFDRLDVRIIFITLYSIVFACCFFGEWIFLLNLYVQVLHKGIF